MDSWTVALTLAIIGLSIEYAVAFLDLNFNGVIRPRALHPITLRADPPGFSLRCLVNNRWRECPDITSNIFTRGHAQELIQKKEKIWNHFTGITHHNRDILQYGTNTGSLFPWPLDKYQYLNPSQKQNTVPMFPSYLDNFFINIPPSESKQFEIRPESYRLKLDQIGFAANQDSIKLEPDALKTTLPNLRYSSYITSSDGTDDIIKPINFNKDINFRISSKNIMPVTTTITSDFKNKEPYPPQKIYSESVKQSFSDKLTKIVPNKSPTINLSTLPVGNPKQYIYNKFNISPSYKIESDDNNVIEQNKNKSYSTPFSAARITNYTESNEEKVAEHQIKLPKTKEFNQSTSLNDTNKLTMDDIKISKNETINCEEVEHINPFAKEVVNKQGRNELLDKFIDVLELFERKFYSATFNKLTSISQPERRENGISFAQSGLFLSLLLMALSTETDQKTKAEIDKALDINITDTEKLEITRYIVSLLPSSSGDLKFRLVSRLVLGTAQNVSHEFTNNTASALHLSLGKFYGNESDEALANKLNEMVEQDSGGAIRDTFDPEEMSAGVRAVALTTLYLRGQWRAAPTVLNGTQPFHDAQNGPLRSSRMIRINDLMRYADLIRWKFHALEISYSTPGLTLLMLIPHGESLRPLAERLRSLRLSEIMQKMVATRVEATLPLYTLRMTLLLPSKLQAMGIDHLISGNATDDGRLKLSHAVQRLMFWSEAGRNAFKDDGIEWDEPPEVKMIVDRPYIFFVRWHNLTLISGNFVM